MGEAEAVLPLRLRYQLVPPILNHLVPTPATKVADGDDPMKQSTPQLMMTIMYEEKGNTSTTIEIGTRRKTEEGEKIKKSRSVLISLMESGGVC